MSEGDEDWRREKESALPLRRGEKLPSPRPAPGKPRPIVHPAPPPAPRTGHAPERIERSLLQRIGKGRETIEARLDLHEMTQEQAAAALTEFIRLAYANGLRTVLVITGKGRGGEGALRRAFVHWLETETLRGYISGYHPASRGHGGDGAWYVRIRRNTESDYPLR